ncbi:glutaminase [Roseibium algae]|uniref:Glutaminase n=1 Tax=Roseibium algae TaxID=3123038 RepID=A0ABU8TMN2_9HYPH
MQDLLTEIADTVGRSEERGKLADYIPELAKIDPGHFAISVATADGSLFSAGDARIPFSIQSISKVFVLALALGRVGEALWKRVGREPSGQAFNSILLLEREKGIPRNPFINAGALVAADTLLGAAAPGEALSALLRFIRSAADQDDIHINEAVASSELDTADRNFALAHYMRSYGNLENSPDRVLGTYCHQCAIEMTCEQLALAGRFLLDTGEMPHLVSRERKRRINSLMMTCGQYDGSGDFAFRVGLPAKSGVGGGILVIAPGRGAISVWSPGLNSYGNSKLGTEAMEAFTRKIGWSVFG